MRAKVGNSGRKLVLIKLADNANDEGVCWPSYQNVADQCEMGRTTVIGHIKQLEKDGYLKKMARNAGRSSNRYYIKFSGEKGGFTGTDSELVEFCTSSDSVPMTSADSEPRTSHSLEPVTIKKSKPKKTAAKAKFVAPTEQEVLDYAIERNRQDLAKKFFDYYDTGNWKDAAGKAVRNWKQKFITWENSNPNQQTGGGYGNGNQSNGFAGETEAQRIRRINAESREHNLKHGTKSTDDHF